MEALSIRPVKEPRYPSSDGRPLSENTWQFRAIADAGGALMLRYQAQPDVFVACDLLIYFERGNPKKSVAPDVFVAFGAPNHDRMTYLLWEEPTGPDFVLEVASASTWREDLGRKRDLYADLGVPEYWLFDPKGEYFSPPLQGLQLAEGGYRPLPAQTENGRRVLHSKILGLDLIEQRDPAKDHRLTRAYRLRFRDPATGEFLRTLNELEADHKKAKARIAELEARLRAPNSVSESDRKADRLR